MPIIVYICECGNVSKKFFRLAKTASTTMSCEKCDKTMKKSLSSPSSISKITVDNGIQARRIEIVPNIIELNEERSSKNYKKD